MPYAAYRVIPDLSAQLLNNLLEQSIISPTRVRKPQQLLVWIPKADAGQYADNWRPLGMPHFASFAGFAQLIPRTTRQFLDYAKLANGKTKRQTATWT